MPSQINPVAEDVQKSIEIVGVNEKPPAVIHLSIKEALVVSVEEKPLPEANLPRSEFNTEQLSLLWQDFLHLIQERHSASTISAIHSLDIKKTGENIITVISPSYTAQSEFEEVKSIFYKMAQKELNHYYLELEFELQENTKDQFILSNEDIYTHMLRKNKDIDILRTELGLDFYE